MSAARPRYGRMEEGKRVRPAVGKRRSEGGCGSLMVGGRRRSTSNCGLLNEDGGMVWRHWFSRDGMA